LGNGGKKRLQTQNGARKSRKEFLRAILRHKLFRHNTHVGINSDKFQRYINLTNPLVVKLALLIPIIGVKFKWGIFDLKIVILLAFDGHKTDQCGKILAIMLTIIW